jgi:hypothetical protein
MNPDPPSPEPVTGIVASLPRLGQTVENSLPPLLFLIRDRSTTAPALLDRSTSKPSVSQSPRLQPPVVTVKPLPQFCPQQSPGAPLYVPHHRTATPSRGLLRPTRHHEMPAHNNRTRQPAEAHDSISLVPIVHQPQPRPAKYMEGVELPFCWIFRIRNQIHTYRAECLGLRDHRDRSKCHRSWILLIILMSHTSSCTETYDPFMI